MLGASSSPTRALAVGLKKTTTTTNFIAARFTSRFGSRFTPEYQPPESTPTLPKYKIKTGPPSSPPASAPAAERPRNRKPASSSPSAARKFRGAYLSVAVTLIVAVGAITGAWIKTDQDRVREAEKVREMSIEDQIAMLEQRQAALVASKVPLERKLEKVRAQMAEEEEEEAQKAAEEKKEV